jgi:hypothetical protein
MRRFEWRLAVVVAVGRDKFRAQTLDRLLVGLAIPGRDVVRMGDYEVRPRGFMRVWLCPLG